LAPVVRTREADGERFHPARQSGVVRRLDDEVHVIALHRKVNDAKVLALREGDRVL